MSLRQRHAGTAAAEPAAKAAPQGTPTATWKRRLAFVRVTDDDHFNLVCTYATCMVVVAFFAEVYFPSGYGRYGANAFIKIDNRLGWWLLEIPVTVSFIYFFFIKGGPQAGNLVPRIMAGIMCFHYAYRGWIFPSLMRPHPDSSFSLILALSSPLVTATHGYLSARWFAQHGKHLTRRWLRDPRFLLGLVMYFSGFSMIVWHDNILRNLRQPGGPRYVIPNEGLFQYVTCAQYLVELWTFFGFFLLSWGPNGLFIFCISFANLVPRASRATAWYVEKFGDEYPADRRHIFPFIY